jgi:hypothetical protein
MKASVSERSRPSSSSPGSSTPGSSTRREPPQRREQPSYYPGYSTLGQAAFWDAATRKTVFSRVENVPEIRFFQPKEAEFWKIVFDHLLPQEDRHEERRIPILNVVDHRLDINRIDGYRFEDMPPDREAYKLGMKAINDEADTLFDDEFVALSYEQREAVLKAIHDGEPRAGKDIWKKMSVHRFWQLMMGDAIDAYYAHPWAWDEIGFGGPAYPRAYMRLERGEPESWEVEERRYEWEPPAGTLSDETESVHEHSIESIQHKSHSRSRRRK